MKFKLFEDGKRFGEFEAQNVHHALEVIAKVYPDLAIDWAMHKDNELLDKMAENMLKRGKNSERVTYV